MAAASAMVARLQPKASCQGTMSTPTAPRTPADTSSADEDGAKGDEGVAWPERPGARWSGCRVTHALQSYGEQ